MLKKIISLVICAASVLCIAACDNVELTRGNVEFPEVIGPAGNNKFPGLSSSSHGDVFYRSFEAACPEFTNVVIATSTGMDSDSYWTFDVQESIFGETEDKICMSMGSSLKLVTSLGGGYGITYYENDKFFETGETYLLMLKKDSSVYYSKKQTFYYTAYATQISLDNISESRMYGESAKRHITGIDIDTCTKEELIEYVKELVKNNKTAKKSISSAETLEEIVRDSTDVVQIKICNPIRQVKNSTKKTEVWECKVTDSLKGDLEKGEMIEIEFFADIVIPNKEYIVALDDDFEIISKSLTTKDSLRPVSEKAEIKGYIN